MKFDRSGIEFVRKLCPHLSEPELEEAAARFKRVLLLLNEIALDEERQKALSTQSSSPMGAQQFAETTSEKRGLEQGSFGF